MYLDRVPTIGAIAEDIAEDNGIEFDPMTILLIVQAIISIIKLYQDCFGSCSAQAVRGYLTTGGPIMQRVRRRFVARHLRRTMGLDEYEVAGGSDFVNAVFDYVKSEDEEVIQQAISEALEQ